MRSWRLLGEVTLVVCVLAVALSTFARARAKFDSDEADWIGTSRYFQTLFVERDFSAEAWPDHYWTRTQPMVSRYLIGAWLWTRGYDLTTLDPTYDPSASLATNRRAGRGPSDDLIREARVPMRILAGLTVAVLYIVVRVVAGPIGGLVAALLAIGSPYLNEHLVRAMGEAPLMFLVLGALLLALISLRGATKGRLSRGWTLSAGVLLGLALGAKLTAVLVMLAVALWGAWAWLAARTKADDRRLTTDDRARMLPTSLVARGRSVLPTGATWALTVLGTAILTFVASNPYLYRDPVGRTALLFQNRWQEMEEQARAVPQRAVPELQDRVAQVWERSLFHETWGGSYLGWPLEAVLAIIGACWLVARAARREPGPEALLLLCTVCMFAGVSWGLGFRLQHYFVPTAVMTTLVAGVGAGWTADALWRTARQRSAVLRHRAPTSAPSIPG